MDRLKAILVATIVAAMALLGLTGCPSPPCCGPAAGAAVVFVYGATTGQPQDHAGPLVDPLRNALAAGHAVSIYNTDHPPTLMFKADPGPDLRAAQSDQFRSTTVEKYVAAALQALEKTAVNPENDPFTSVVEACRATGGDGDVWVAASFLSTAGPARFQDDDLLHAEPDDITDQLSHNIGTVGCHLHIWGIGDVAAPQERLSEIERENLDAIVEGGFTASGATVDILRTPRTGDGPAGAPPVTTVPVQPTVIDVPAAAVPVEIPLPSSTTFLPDSAELRDAAVTAEMLRPFQTWSARNPAGSLEIHGTTARTQHPHREQQEALSLQRASAVRALLVADGVTNAIQCFGWGSYSKWYRSETNANGEYDTALLAQNRRIFIIAIP